MARHAPTGPVGLARDDTLQAARPHPAPPTFPPDGSDARLTWLDMQLCMDAKDYIECCRAARRELINAEASLDPGCTGAPVAGGACVRRRTSPLTTWRLPFSVLRRHGARVSRAATLGNHPP